MSVQLFYIAWFLFRYGTIFVKEAPSFRYNIFVALMYAGIFYVFMRIYNGYMLGYSRVRALVIAQSISQFFTCGIVYIIISLSWFRLYNPAWLLAVHLVQIPFNCVWSYFVTKLFYKYNPPKKTLFIYRDPVDKLRFGSIVGKPVGNIYEVVNELQYTGNSFRKIENEIKKYDAVFVAGVESKCRNGIIKYCVETGTPGFFLPHIGDVLMQGAQHIQSFSSPVHYFSRKKNKVEYLFIKRAFDIITSLLAIIILSPILLITAILIKAYDHGPAIYKQPRYTKDGRIFQVYKFRSMRVGSDKGKNARACAGDDDDRITPIGRFARKCRFDELPQLFNILKGDMSVVGPRPEWIQMADQYHEVIPEFKLRLQVKAGLTGYAQIYGKYNSDPYEKLEFDLLYINNMSIVTDLRLIFATIAILFVPESTEGIGDGATTALKTVDKDDNKEGDS